MEKKTIHGGVFMKVLNMGSLNLDYVYSVDHIILPGETEDTGSRNIFLGGKGMNQSCALAKAGVEVYHAGLIGADGQAFLDACKDGGAAPVPTSQIIYNQAIIDGIVRSANCGREVEINVPEIGSDRVRR